MGEEFEAPLAVMGEVFDVSVYIEDRTCTYG
jgi:hypothetical protein